MDFEVVVVLAVDGTAIMAVGVGSIIENGIGWVGWIGCIGGIGGIGVCMEGAGTGCVTTDCGTGEGKTILGSNGEGENDSMEEIEDNVGRKVVRKI